MPARKGTHGLLDADRRSLVHTGRMASSQRCPAPLLEAVRLLRSRGSAAARRLELVFAGPLTAEERALLEAPDLAGMVRHVGNLDRDDALRLQREADGLLLLTAGTRRGEATGKLFEYLGAERPILVLGDQSEAARIVTGAGAGLAAPAADPEAIASALERCRRASRRRAARLLLSGDRSPLRGARRAGAQPRGRSERHPVERLLHRSGQRAPGPPGAVDEPARGAQRAGAGELRSGRRAPRAWPGSPGSCAGSPQRSPASREVSWRR